MSRLAVLLILLLLAACTPPAPTPTPTPTAALTDYTPWPPVTLTPGTYPSPPDNRPSRTPEPTATLVPYPLATAAPLQEETATPMPYPVETREAMGIEPVTPEPLPTPEPRKGVAAALGGGFVICDGREWQLWWSAAYAIHDKVCPTVQHVPYLVRGGDKPGRIAFEWELIERTIGRMSHDYWLVFNEPESQYQGDITPEKAVELFHDEIAGRFLLMAPDAKLIIGGVNGGHCGLRWLEEFITRYREQYGEIPNLAGYHVHLYPDLWAGPLCDQPWQWNWAGTLNGDEIINGWLDQAANVKAFMLRYGRPGDELWVTETSCLAPPPAACYTSAAAIAKTAVDWLNDEGRWITRIAWYADYDNHWWHWTRLYTTPPNIDGEGGQLTPAGEIWLNAELLPTISLQYHRRYFPIIGYGADVIPTPPATPIATPTPPGYPGAGDLHP